MALTQKQLGQIQGGQSLVGAAGTLAAGFIQRGAHRRVAKWMKKRGALAERLESWNQAQIRGEIRAATSDRAAGDTLHLRLSNEISAGLAISEAGLPYKLAAIQEKEEGQQAMFQGISDASAFVQDAAWNFRKDEPPKTEEKKPEPTILKTPSGTRRVMGGLRNANRGGGARFQGGWGF